MRSFGFDKILVTDWESLANYYTGDLLTRWGNDAGNIAGGVLNFIPNLVVLVFKFISALAAVFAFMSMPVSLLLSKTLMRRMINNNKRSAALNAKLSGFNQETFANIQTIKALDLIKLYSARLRSNQKKNISI